MRFNSFSMNSFLPDMGISRMHRGQRPRLQSASSTSACSGRERQRMVEPLWKNKSEVACRAGALMIFSSVATSAYCAREDAKTRRRRGKEGQTAEDGDFANKFAPSRLRVRRIGSPEEKIMRTRSRRQRPMCRYAPMLAPGARFGRIQPFFVVVSSACTPGPWPATGESA